MSFIIDGHNLIPKVPGIHLSDPNDEHNLIALLQDYCRVSRKRVEVYFDQAAVGQTSRGSYGIVTVRFARSGQTADDAIGARLRQMRRAARNWTVVSSDQRVQTYARAAHASVMSAEDFARLLVNTLHASGETQGDRQPAEMSPAELDEWLRLFSDDEPE